MRSAYHITRVENLRHIWQSGLLLCDAQVAELKDAPATFAYENIKERRRRTPVTVGPKGNLCDYVPFYFCNRSPMLFTVHCRDQALGTRDQDRVVHFRINVEQVVEKDLPFVFTDGHGIMALTEFYDNSDDLEKIDWAIIRSKSWYDSIQEPDRKRKKQAEFLIYKCLHIKYIQEIGVRTAAVRGEVSTILAFESVLPPICLRPEWYYA